MKHTIALFVLAFLAFTAKGQLERAAFTEVGRGAVNAFATDYHALGINPANLAFGNQYNKKFTVGFGQLAASNYGEGFTRSEMMDAIRNRDQELSFNEQFDAAQRFADAAVAIDITALALGFALNTAKAGNFAFSVSARATHFSRFNETASSHLWTGFIDPYFDLWVVPGEGGVNDTVPNGGAGSPLLDDVLLGLSSNPQNVSNLYDGTVARSMGFIEYNFGYGRTIFENEDLRIHGGLGMKYLRGLFLLDVAIRDQELSRAYLAYTPAFNADFGEASANNPSNIPGSSLQSVGSGFGFDLGLALELNEQLRISAAITDIGSITFDGNVYSARDTVLFDIETTGVESFSFESQIDVFTGDQGVFAWEGQEEQRFRLPTMLRVGFAYMHSEKFNFGLDLALPFNDEPGSIDRLGFAAGIDYIPVQTVRLSSGIAAGDNYGFRVPFGINFVVDEGSWEFGLATRDVLFFARDNRPNISIAMGFLRFRFGTWQRQPMRRMFE